MRRRRDISIAIAVWSLAAVAWPAVGESQVSQGPGLQSERSGDLKGRFAGVTSHMLPGCEARIDEFVADADESNPTHIDVRQHLDCKDKHGVRSMDSQEHFQYNCEK